MRIPESSPVVGIASLLLSIGVAVALVVSVAQAPGESDGKGKSVIAAGASEAAPAPEIILTETGDGTLVDGATEDTYYVTLSATPGRSVCVQLVYDEAVLTTPLTGPCHVSFSGWETGPKEVRVRASGGHAAGAESTAVVNHVLRPVDLSQYGSGGDPAAAGADTEVLASKRLEVTVRGISDAG